MKNFGIWSKFEGNLRNVSFFKVILPSRYRFQAIVTKHDTPSIIVTASSITVLHRPSASFNVNNRSSLFITVF